MQVILNHSQWSRKVDIVNSTHNISVHRAKEKYKTWEIFTEIHQVIMVQHVILDSFKWKWLSQNAHQIVPAGCFALSGIKEYPFRWLGLNLLELITKCSWYITQSGIIGFNFQKEQERKVQLVALLSQKQSTDHALGFTYD